VATARLDRRTKNLTKRLAPGDIAIIDHVDLDRVSAASLISRQVSAVVNVAPSISGRYPNLGPRMLLEAGVPLIDDIGPEVFEQVKDGKLVRLDGDTLYLGEVIIAKGTVQTAESVAEDMATAEEGPRRDSSSAAPVAAVGASTAMSTPRGVSWGDLGSIASRFTPATVATFTRSSRLTRQPSRIPHAR